MIRLALTDLDNTLIPLHQGCASERSRAAIHAMLDAGLRFGPVTGRVPAAMRWMFAGDEACHRTGAFVNGQIIYVDGRLVHELTIEGELLDEVARYLADWEGAALGLYDIDRVTGISDGEVAYVGATAAELERHAHAFPRPYTVLAHVARPRYTKTNVRCDLAPERMGALTAGLRGRFGDDLAFVSPMAGGPFIDILPAGWDKGRAVEEIMGIVGLAPDEVAAFGDSENDLAMLAVVGHPVAVANATAEVVAASRWHIGDSADDAVAGALADIAAAASTGGMPAFMV